MKAKELDEQMRHLDAVTLTLRRMPPLPHLALVLQAVTDKLERHRQELEAEEKGDTHVPLVCERCREVVDALYDVTRDHKQPPGTEAAEKGEGEIKCGRCNKVLPANALDYWDDNKVAFCPGCYPEFPPTEKRVPPSTEARLEALEDWRTNLTSQFVTDYARASRMASSLEVLERAQVDHKCRLDAHWDCIQGPQGLGKRLEAKLKTLLVRADEQDKSYDELYTSERDKRREQVTKIRDEIANMAGRTNSLQARLAKLEGALRWGKDFEQAGQGGIVGDPLTDGDSDVSELVGAMRQLRSVHNPPSFGCALTTACARADAVLKKRDAKRGDEDGE